jgi:hypothetical protein
MITRAQMPRQLRDKGGIASVTPRENYGLGSKIKERFRKLIPNELADVAVKAAPFVAPFNPGIAGLMRGIGRFDQRGSISDAVKQGAATFGFGAGARALGGADPFGGGLKGGFTSPLSEGRTTAVKNLFKGDPKITPDGTKREGPKLIQKGVDALKEKIPLLKNVKDDVAQKLLVGGLTSGASALYSYFTGEFEPQEPGESLEEYMARRRESVKSQMRQVMDSYYTPLRNPQYAAMSDEEKDNFIDGIVGQGMAMGGRAGYQTGGITMANTLAENIRRNLANQAAVAQQFRQARSRIPGYVAPQKTPVQEYATSDDSILGPLSKKAASTIMAGQDKSQAALDVLNQTIAPTTDTGIMTQSPTTDTAQISGAMDSLINVNKQPIQYSNIPELTRLMDDVNQKANDTVIRSLAEADKYLKMQAGPPKKIIPEEGTIGPITKLPVAPDPDTPIDELIRPITPTLPVEPRTDQDLIEGFAKFKEQNPEVMQGAGTLALIEGTLPDGTPITFTGGLESNAFNKYLESLGLSRSDILAPIAPIAPMVAPFEKYGITPEQYANMSPEDQEAVMNRVDRDMGIYGDNIGKRIYGIPDDEADDYGITFAKGGRVNFEEGGTGFMKWLKSNYGLEVKDLDLEQYVKLSREFNNENPDPYETGRKKNAMGSMPTGIMRTNKAGVMERDYRDKGGFVPVGIKEKADDVPAMLSKNEFVFTADAVRGAGNGSIEKGAQKMYDTMKNLEKRVT